MSYHRVVEHLLVLMDLLKGVGTSRIACITSFSQEKAFSRAKMGAPKKTEASVSKLHRVVSGPTR